MISISRALALLLFFVTLLPIVSLGQSASAPSERPFVVEYYYKTKWGHADEFLKLFKKNHYPRAEERNRVGKDRRKSGWTSRAITLPKTGAGIFV